jgi:hypothetical protein
VQEVIAFEAAEERLDQAVGLEHRHFASVSASRTLGARPARPGVFEVLISRSQKNRQSAQMSPAMTEANFQPDSQVRSEKIYLYLSFETSFVAFCCILTKMPKPIGSLDTIEHIVFSMVS